MTDDVKQSPVGVRDAGPEDAEFLLDMLLEAVNWTGEERVSRKQLLRDRRLGGLKFRRQFTFEDGPYIVDFICFRHRLIVEADGPQHDARAQDAARDDWLRGQGFQVLRFPNQQIENHGEQVVGAILAAAGERLTRD